MKREAFQHLFTVEIKGWNILWVCVRTHCAKEWRSLDRFPGSEGGMNKERCTGQAINRALLKALVL